MNHKIVSLHAGYDYRGRTVDGYLARPVAPGTYPGLVLISGMSGLNAFQREMTRVFARAGFVTLSPDLFDGYQAPDHATQLLAKNSLDVDQTTVLPSSTVRRFYIRRRTFQRFHTRQPKRHSRDGVQANGESRQMDALTKFVARSTNRKLGPMPCSYVEKTTCPPACPLMGAGCYGEAGPVSIHWNNVKTPWRAFLGQVKAIPAGVLWRHAVAGDLPGKGNSLDTTQLWQLAFAQ